MAAGPSGSPGFLMIDLPNYKDAFTYENNFYLSCSPSRIGKMLAHYELYKKVQHLEGAFVECGVFKGASFSRFSIFRELFSKELNNKMIAFDIFDEFPETSFEGDKALREKLIKEAGANSISVEQLQEVLTEKNCASNVDLVKGDICETVPKYVSENPDLKIALLNLDVDIYEPSVVILEHLYPKIVSGGILILDDYNVFPGETKAVDEYFSDNKMEIEKFSFAKTPYYIIKK